MKIVILNMVGVLALLFAGCANEGSKAHKVSGKVVVESGEVQQLAGHLVEVVSINDPSLRASGTIEKDGRFRLESLEQGKVVGGVKPGSYKAKITIVDEGEGQAKQPKIPARFLSYDSSGWDLIIPSKTDVTLSITPQ